MKPPDVFYTILHCPPNLTIYLSHLYCPQKSICLSPNIYFLNIDITISSVTIDGVIYWLMQKALISFQQVLGLPIIFERIIYLQFSVVKEASHAKV